MPKKQIESWKDAPADCKNCPVCASKPKFHEIKVDNRKKVYRIYCPENYRHQNNQVYISGTILKKIKLNWNQK